MAVLYLGTSVSRYNTVATNLITGANTKTE